MWQRVLKTASAGLAWMGGLLAWVAGGAVALSLAGAVALWWWSGSAQSLGQALRWASDYLADAETGERPLQAEGATGSLQAGGRIERLRWSQNGLTVELDGFTLAWSPAVWATALLDRTIAIDTLSAQRVRVTDQRPPEPPSPREPPPPLRLPWFQALSVPLQVDELVWAQVTPLTLRQLQADYRYGPNEQTDGGRDQPWHRLKLNNLQWMDGRYSAQLNLQADGDMQLNAQAEGSVPARLPESGRTLPLQARIAVQGSIGTPDALLQVQATVNTPDPSQAQAPRLSASADIRPWASLPVAQADLDLAHVDLALFWPTAPQTRLSGQWQVRTEATTSGSTPDPDPVQALAKSPWRVSGQLTNALPGPWDRQRLPVERLAAQLTLTPERWWLQQLDGTVAGGRLQGQGEVRLRNGQPSSWQGDLRVERLLPAQLLSSARMQPANLTASARAEGTDLAATTFDVRLQPANATAPSGANWPAPQLTAIGQWRDGRLRLDRLQLQAWQAALEAQGEWQMNPSRLQGQATLKAPGLSAQLQAQGQAPTQWPARGIAAQARLSVTHLSDLQRWSLQTLADLQRVLPDLKLADQVPPVWRDARWKGQTESQAQLDGETWRWQHTGQLQWEAAGVQWQNQHEIKGGGQWNAAGLTGQLDALQLQLRNNRDPLGATVQLQGTPTFGASPSGDFRLGAGTLVVMPLQTGPRRPTTWATQPLQLAWQHLGWRDGVLSTQGRMQGMALSWLNAWLSTDAAPQGPLHQAGLQGDITLAGAWDVVLPLMAPAKATTAPPTARVQASLRRDTGDLTLIVGTGPRSERIPAGLQDVSLALQWQGTQVDARLRWQTANAGQAQADVNTVLQPPAPNRPGWAWADEAPLRGSVQADFPQVGLWSKLAPPGWRVSGRVQAQATLSGTRASPDWQGQLQARQLAVRSLADGLDFSDGELQASVNGQVLTIDKFQLRGAGGTNGGLLTGQGSARWRTATVDGQTQREPLIELQLKAQQLRLLARADRRLTLSGTLAAQLQGQRLDLTGKLNADQALFLLPDESTPTLGTDVVVRGTERPPGFGAGSPVQAHVNVDLDLGQNFQVRGLGLETYLTGQLKLGLTPRQSGPQITGQVQTVRGSYRAYGQALGIEQGVIRFNGPVDNPSLDILALRPHPTMRVGVQISGTAQAPRVRLYADPDMPDSEKLAWLVLGRPATGAGAEAAVLQQAALALLSGGGSTNDRSFTRALGLDELSLQGQSTAADGTTTAAALTLGKRISNQLYVTYSRSVTGAMGTVAVFYDISRFVTLRMQAGDDNAIDLLFTYTFDGR